MNDYLKKFAEKVDALINETETLNEADLKQLGQKEQDEEVKKFIEVNTQQLAPEKYLCPLSGKKFKGPEFVKKHIITKHAEKVEAVKKGQFFRHFGCFCRNWFYNLTSEVSFFNAYLSDAKRPAEVVQTAQYRPPPSFKSGAPPPRHHHGQHHHHVSKNSKMKGPGNKPPRGNEPVSRKLGEINLVTLVIIYSDLLGTPCELCCIQRF